MIDFLKKNIFIIALSSITLFIGFLTFLTFIDRSFIELNQNNLQYLLILNIFLLVLLFTFIFFEIQKSIKNEVILGRHLGIDFSWILVDFGRFRVPHRSKIDGNCEVRFFEKSCSGCSLGSILMILGVEVGNKNR